MVIIRVSRSSEKVMLSTVRMLRRLLRNALLVTKRVRVMRLRKTYWLKEKFLSRKASPNCASPEDKAAVAEWTTGIDLSFSGEDLRLSRRSKARDSTADSVSCTFQSSRGH